jgi:hypothetical protein
MKKPLPQAPIEPARRLYNGKPDDRYSLAYEWLGYSEPMLALRFCGDLIGVPHGIIQARRIANAHYEELFADALR